MHVLSPAAFIFLLKVRFTHGFLPRKSGIFNEDEGKLALSFTKNNFPFSLLPFLLLYISIVFVLYHHHQYQYHYILLPRNDRKTLQLPIVFPDSNASFITSILSLSSGMRVIAPPPSAVVNHFKWASSSVLKSSSVNSLISCSLKQTLSPTTLEARRYMRKCSCSFSSIASPNFFQTLPRNERKVSWFWYVVSCSVVTGLLPIVSLNPSPMFIPKSLSFWSSESLSFWIFSNCGLLTTFERKIRRFTASKSAISSLTMFALHRLQKIGVLHFGHRRCLISISLFSSWLPSYLVIHRFSSFLSITWPQSISCTNIAPASSSLTTSAFLLQTWHNLVEGSVKLSLPICPQDSCFWHGWSLLCFLQGFSQSSVHLRRVQYNWRSCSFVGCWQGWPQSLQGS